MKVKVTKTSVNENTFNTPVEDLGEMPNDPVVGQSLIILAVDSEYPGIATSPVERIKELDNGFEIDTQNSTYVIEKLK